MKHQRTMADVRGPVTVFLVGMRINHLLKFRQWVPVAMAMRPMLKELFINKELGMLGAKTFRSGRTVMVVSYWSSFEALEAYARSDSQTHRPAWTAFYRRSKGAEGAVGIFHETYTAQPGSIESLYVDIPAGFGLGGALGSAPVTRSTTTARQRRGAGV